MQGIIGMRQLLYITITKKEKVIYRPIVKLVDI
jgi:hypothetical protein